MKEDHCDGEKGKRTKVGLGQGESQKRENKYTSQDDKREKQLPVLPHLKEYFKKKAC